MEKKYYAFKKYKTLIILGMLSGSIGGFGSLLVGVFEKDMRLVLSSTTIILCVILLGYYIYKADQK